MSNNKFESLLELLINEENDKAEALFHEIVVEKSRDIYENLADEEVTAESKDEEVKETEASEEKVEETTEEKVEETAKDESVEEASEESKDEQVDEVVEIEDEATESETTEEESIEEVGGDATDELVKDISSEEEGEMDAGNGEEMPADMDADKGEEGMEDRVVDLEDALDELKAEFEAMMGKKDGDEEEKDETVEMPASETPEMPVEGKKADMKKEKMDEYKIQKSADTADHADHKSSPVTDAGNKLPKGGKITQGGADEKGRPAPTAQKMSDFENTPGKDKSTSYKKQGKADTADHSDKSAKSPVANK